MGLLSNGSDLLGVNPYWQQAIIGAIIIMAGRPRRSRKRRFATIARQLGAEAPRA